MADLHYWRIVESTDADDRSMAEAGTDVPTEVTMLATGDVLADINTMTDKATDGPWQKPLLQFLKSSSYGDEPAEDGKDKYRTHCLVMSIVVSAPEVLAEYP